VPIGSVAARRCFSRQPRSLTRKAPERPRQPSAREHCLRLIQRKTPPAWLEPASMPLLRHHPHLLRREYRASIQSSCFAPPMHMLFRPEKEHGASGEHDVLPPARRRHGEMHHSVSGLERSSANRERERRLAIRAHGRDVAIAAEHRDDT